MAPGSKADRPILTYKDCTCALVRRSGRFITRLYDDALHETGLSITQYSILSHIEDNEALSVTGLAALMKMERTTVIRNLRPLERDGLIDSTLGADNRSKALRITAEGKRRLLHARKLWSEMEASVREKITPQELQTLRSLLARLVEPA